MILGAEILESRMPDTFAFDLHVFYVLVLKKGGDRYSSCFGQIETSMCKHFLSLFYISI